MGKGETEENSQSECDGRRKQSRERKRESENKNSFRESRHQSGKEYQAGSRMSQQEQGKPLISCRGLLPSESRRASFFFRFRGRSGGRGFFLRPPCRWRVARGLVALAGASLCLF